MANVTVILTSALAGPDFSLAPGDEYACHESVAERLISAGLAVPKEAEQTGDKTRRSGREGHGKKA